MSLEEPEDGMYVTITMLANPERKFFFSTKELTAMKAIEICKENGARLYEPRYRQLNEMVEEKARELDSSFTGGFWIGIHRENVFHG